MQNVHYETTIGKILKIALVFMGAFVAFLTITSYADEKGTDVSPKIITKDIRCPLCGMYPARYEEWQAQVVFNDGSFAAFDGCKHLFGFLLEMGKYDTQHTMRDVATIHIKDFSSNKWINAKDAHFVVGSSVLGPMGREIIPFNDHEEATTFTQKRGGMHAHFADITMETIKSLEIGKKMKGHTHQ